MSNISRRVAVVAAVAAVLLGVAACTPPAPTPSSGAPSPTGTTAAPPATTAPAPTPTPSAAAIAPPTVRIPLDCSDLATSDQLHTALGAYITETPSGGVQTLDQYEAVQDGALDCSWEVPESTNGNDPSYQILMMPDATAIWNQYKDELKGLATGPSPYGANSYYNCYSSPKDLVCGVDKLVGSTWLSISSQSGKFTTSLSTATLLANFKPLMSKAITSLQGATVVEPRWTNPSASVPTLPKTGAVSTKKISAALSQRYAMEVEVTDLEAEGPIAAQQIPVDYRQTGGGGSGAGGSNKYPNNYGMSVEILPSGSWAWNEIIAAAGSEPGYQTLTGVGDQAIQYNETSKDEPYDTVIEGTAGGNLYSIEVWTGKKSPRPDTTAIAKKAAAYVVGTLK